MIRFSVPRLPAPARWTVVGLVAGTILVASVVDPGQSGAGPPGDKLLHGLAYATLGLALAYATLDWDRRAWRVVAVVGLAVGYGLAMELLQAAIPYRAFSLADLAADGAGAVAALTWFAAERVARYVDVPLGDAD